MGEIGSFRSGVGFPESEQGGMAGIPFYKVSDMNLSENNTVMNISSNYVTDDQISRNKWKPIDGNTIIFAKVGAAVFLERKRQTRCKFLIDNNMMSYKPNSIQDHDYIYYTFQNLNLSHYAQIGSLPSLNAGELKNVNIVLPDQNEQSKVSQLFLNLDR
ncbi:restriction endonuclease subunit S, partial [Limosilactobacillus mucosae]|uniref:restriction endonuclease subunit S n=1 Tax=Limosilactobacillus mucosae TaxID=97478 RepID=UPI003993686E